MKNKIICGLVMMVLISSVVVASNAYGDDVSIVGYFIGAVNQSNDIEYIVWYESGVAYASKSGIVVYSGANNSSVLQSALTNSTQGSEIKIISPLTLHSNITIPTERSLLGTRNVPPGNVDEKMFLFLNTNSTIKIKNYASLRNIGIIALDLNKSFDYVDSAPVWNGTAITIEGERFLIENLGVFGFDTCIKTVGNYPGRTERLNLDCINGIVHTLPIYDVDRVRDVHLWPFATDSRNGTEKRWLRNYGYKTERCDGCLVQELFVFYNQNAIWVNGSSAPVTIPNPKLDGLPPNSTAITLLNGSVVNVIGGYTTSGDHTTTGIFVDNTSVITATAFSITGGLYGIYIEGDSEKNSITGVSTRNTDVDYHYNNTNLFYGNNSTFPYTFSNGVFYGTFDAQNLTAQDTVSAGTLKSNNLYDSINYVVDGSGVSPDTGVQTGDIEVANACDIEAARFKADQAGYLAVTILKAPYGGAFSEIGTTSMTANTWYQDTALSGWTTHISAGDWLRYRIDSVDSVTYATISLKCKR